MPLHHTVTWLTEGYFIRRLYHSECVSKHGKRRDVVTWYRNWDVRPCFECFGDCHTKLYY
jgi:hypothetical protein